MNATNITIQSDFLSITLLPPPDKDGSEETVLNSSNITLSLKDRATGK